MGATFLTGDILILPSVVLLGSFLVPVTAVIWYLDHDPSPALSPSRVITGFIIAGALGVLAAAVLESYLVFGPGLIGNLKVGLIEEFVKGAAIVLLALGLRSYATRDGMVLGAAVGFGFAAPRAAATRWPRCLSCRAISSSSRCRPSSSRSSFGACWPRLVTVSGRRFLVA